MGEYVDSFYTGGYSSLNPNYGNYIGYRMSAEGLGFPGSAQTANQLTESINAIKQGVKAFEVTMVSPETADMIPKQHFKEMRALMSLSGVKPSVHAPIIDPAGFGEKGWDGDLAREDTERRLFATLEKAHELDPEGNIPIVFHSSNTGIGSEYRPDKDKKPGEEGRFHEKRILVIDPETKEIKTLQEDLHYLPGMTKEGLAKGKIRTPRGEIDLVNRNQWDSQLTNFAMLKKEADESFRRLAEKTSRDKELLELFKKNKLETQEEVQKLSSIEPDLNRTNLFIENTQQSFTTLFDKAYRYGTTGQKEKLAELSENWAKEQKKAITEINEKGEFAPLAVPSAYSSLLDKYFMKLQKITYEEAGGETPIMFKPVEEFARGKSAETFSNIAVKSYEKYKDSSPIIAIENMYPGMANAKSEDLKKLIEETKSRFIKTAIKPSSEGGFGLSESEAKKKANKIIGATWDVGHLNLLRKQGFTEEDIIQETKKIAPLVKHIHLTDNFGYSDSHLPPGMGNVPIKRILEELEKKGDIAAMRKIVEAPNFVQHFKKSPHPYTMAAFGAPTGVQGAYWNQVVDSSGGYFGFPMAYLPEKHFSMYGSGFSTLPEELGGQIPGTNSRFSGTPNT